MSLLSISGLKKAYESLGEGISRSFDSSQSENPGAGAGAPDDKKGEVSAPLSLPGDEPGLTGEKGGEEVERGGEEVERGGEVRGGEGGEMQGRVKAATVGETGNTPRGMKLSSSVSKEGERTREPMSTQSPPATSDGGRSPATPSPLANSTPAKSGGKLDSLSRAELVKYIKKQAQLLQRSKARCDELSKECSELKRSSETDSCPPQSSLPNSEALLEELQVVRGERDKAVAEQRTLQQMITSLKQDKQSLAEQMLVVEREVAALQSREEDWKCKVEAAATQLTAQEQEHVREREELESRLAARTEDRSKAELEKTREELEPLKRECGVLQERVSALQAQQTTLQAERNTLQQEHDSLLVERAELHRGRDELLASHEELQQNYDRLQDSHQTEKAALLSECERAREGKAALEVKVETMSERLKQAERQSTEAEHLLNAATEDGSAVHSRVEELEREIQSLESRLASANSENETFQKTSATELKVANDQLEAVQKQLNGREADVVSLKSELETERCKLEGLERECASLRESRDEVGERGREIQQLRDEVSRLQRDKQEVERREQAVREEAEVAVQREQEAEKREQAAREEAELAVQREQEAEKREQATREEAELAVQRQQETEKREQAAREEAELAVQRQQETEKREQAAREEAELAVQREQEAEKREQAAREEAELAVQRQQEAERREQATREEAELAVKREQEVERREQAAREEAEVAVKRQQEAEKREQATREEAELAVQREQEAEKREQATREEAELAVQRQQEAEKREQAAREEAELAVKREQEAERREQATRGEAELSVKTEQEAEKRVREEVEVAIRREQEVSQQALNEQAIAHKDETKKLKAFIVKMKREMADLRGKMAVPVEEREELQRQLGELRASVEAGNQSVTESETKRVQAEEALQSVREELGGFHSERDCLQSSLATATEELSTLRSELSTAQSDLATFQTQVGSAQRGLETAEKEAWSLKEELARERESHSATKQKLTSAMKEAKASSVMNLELADYQRSLQALEEKLAGKEEELEKMREEERKQQDKMATMRKETDLQTQQCIAAEDKLSKTKAVWMKTKKELEGSRKAEGELQAAMVSLSAQLEGEKQLAEQSKAEMSTLTAKLQSMQQQSDSSVGVLQKTVRSLEHKLAAAQNELLTSQLALSQCQQDYNSYKVRVHSVLKQKNSGPSPAEISTEIRQKFETEIIQLRAELQDSKSQLSSALAELEELSDDHHQLTAAHQQLQGESRQQIDTAKRRLEEAESRHSIESREQTELIGQLRQEVMEVTEAFRGQLHSLQEEHQRAMASLREDLDLSRDTVSRLQQEADARVLARASIQPEQSSGHAHSGRQMSHDHKIPDPVPSEQRSSGEGMDQSELDSAPSLPLAHDDSQLSLERLLSTADSESSVPPSSLLDKSRSGTSLDGGTVSEPQLHKDLAKAMKTIRGLNDLLRESEESTVRLGEQAKVLKEEIRRLERNREREEGVSNMEYLKNVVLEFLHSDHEDSAKQTELIPVITQLLRLSPQETKFLQDTVRGDPASLPDASSSLPSPSAHKGLAGYIHRWTGY